MDVKIALIGGGNVGQGFLAQLRKKREMIQARTGITFQLVAVCDRISGSLLSSSGLRITDIIPLLEDGAELAAYPTRDQACIKGLDPFSTIELSQADVVVECTYSELKTGEPASSYIRKALSMRKHVVTANKGPVALHYAELSELARANAVHFLFEGTVMSGTPVIQLLRSTLRMEEVLDIKAQISCSTNHILTELESDRPMDEILREARDWNLLEADPEMDLDGHDAKAKLMILLNVITGANTNPGFILREGIQGIGSRDIQNALSKDLHYRMIASAWKEKDGSWHGHVGPHKLNRTDRFCSLPALRSALLIKTETLGEIFLEGPGTGKLETGQAILSDLLSIYS